MSKNKPISHEKIAIQRMTNVTPATAQAKSLSRLSSRVVSHNIKKNEDYNPLIPKAIPRTEVPPSPVFGKSASTATNSTYLKQNNVMQKGRMSNRKSSESLGLVPQTPLMS